MSAIIWLVSVGRIASNFELSTSLDWFEAKDKTSGEGSASASLDLSGYFLEEGC